MNNYSQINSIDIPVINTIGNFGLPSLPEKLPNYITMDDITINRNFNKVSDQIVIHYKGLDIIALVNGKGSIKIQEEIEAVRRMTDPQKVLLNPEYIFSNILMYGTITGVKLGTTSDRSVLSYVMESARRINSIQAAHDCNRSVL